MSGEPRWRRSRRPVTRNGSRRRASLYATLTEICARLSREESRMRPKLAVFLIVVCAMVSLARAQNSVDGKWVGEVQGGRGPQTITIALKADGGTLTGSITGGRGGEVAIKEGTISGSSLKFKSTQMGRGGEINLSWSGTLKGDEIAMTRTVEGGQGQSQEFTLKRQK